MQSLQFTRSLFNIAKRMTPQNVKSTLVPVTVALDSTFSTVTTLGELNLETDTTQRFKVYTKTGDKGTSSLYTGVRLPKTDAIFEALGSTDELSSLLGHAREFCNDSTVLQCLAPQITTIQCCLQDIGSNIATPHEPDSSDLTRKQAKTRFDSQGSHLKNLELWIDDYDATLPPLTKFILPSGNTIKCL